MFFVTMMLVGCITACPMNETETTAPESQACQDYQSTNDCQSYRECVNSKVPIGFGEYEPFLDYICENVSVIYFCSIMYDSSHFFILQDESATIFLLNEVVTSPPQDNATLTELIAAGIRIWYSNKDFFVSLKSVKKMLQADGLKSIRKEKFWWAVSIIDNVSGTSSLMKLKQALSFY